MSHNNINTAVSNISCRLFDHRSFLNGEIQFALHELEEKRNDKEIESLFTLLELITDFKETHIPKSAQTVTVAIPQIIDNIDAGLSLCNAIENAENKYLKEDNLEIKREIRKNEWQQFVDEVSQKCSQIDGTFQQKEGELQDLYKDLERKINITNTF